MNLSCGLVGFPNAGKSTLFNALRSAQGKLLQGEGVKTANYPFTTIEPNVGVVEVPDERLEKLADVIARDSSSATQNDKKGWVDDRPPIVPAVVKFVDIAGLVKGAHKGEGLGNQFLAHIREVDVIVFVLRDFKSEDIVKTGENPTDDLEVLRDELLLKDLETVEKRLRSRDQDLGKDKEIIEKAKGLIEQGKWLRDEMDDEEIEKIGDLQLLSCKKTVVVVNCDEGDLMQSDTPPKEFPLKGTMRICAKMEEELAGLSNDEQIQYLKELGIGESGLNRLIKKAYEVLNLMSFYTAGPKEARAWTIQKGSLAPQAAGVIHTDFERGFIATDIVDFDKFVQSNGWKGARERGLVRTIGKSEVMPQDVVVEFKFSV